MRLRLFASLRDKVTSSAQSPVPLLVGPSQGSSLSILTEPHVGLHVLPERENGRQSMFDRAFGDLFAPCDDHPIGGADHASRTIGSCWGDCGGCHRDSVWAMYRGRAAFVSFVSWSPRARREMGNHDRRTRY